MKITNVNGIVAKTLMVALAAGTMMVAGGRKAQAQQWGVGVQFGQPAYRYYPDYDRRTEEYREHEQREEFARRQAYLQHEQWEHEQREALERRQAYLQHEYWERAHRFHHHDDDDDR
jgi:hypothetical protein